MEEFIIIAASKENTGSFPKAGLHGIFWMFESDQCTHTASQLHVGKGGKNLSPWTEFYSPS